MKAWPPKPGLTDMTRMRSMRSITCSIVLAQVPGLRVTPAFLPSARIACSERWMCGPGFDMDRDDVGARLGEGFEIGIARRDHQVDVERLLAVGPQRLHHVGSDRDVGHEMAVHHVDVDPVGAGRVDRPHLLAEPGEVGGQDGWGYDEGRGHQVLFQFAARLTRAPGAGNAASRAAAALRSRHELPGMCGSGKCCLPGWLRVVQR